MYLTGSKSTSSKDTLQGQPEKEDKQGEAVTGAGHSGYGANRKSPYTDEQ